MRICEAEIADIRPISGHLVLDTTAIYNKLNKAKATQAAAARRDYVRALSEKLSENPPKKSAK